MYARDGQLGDWKSTLAKVRKSVHRIFPRELSPTRMLEKYASDTKKKSAAKLSTLQSASDARNAADDEALAKKIQTLELTALPPSSSQTNLLDAVPGHASAPNTTPDPLTVAGLFGVGALALFFVMGKKR